MKTSSLIFILFLLIGCASTPQFSKPSEALKTIVTKRTFTIYSDWAEPQFSRAFSQLSAIGFTPGNNVGGLIDISGFTNYLTFKNDSVFGYFPYYGERHIGNGNSSIDQGIQFKGLLEDIEIIEKGSTYKLKFEIKDAKAQNERYKIRVQLNSKLKTLIDIKSSHRNSISYEGDVTLND